MHLIQVSTISTVRSGLKGVVEENITVEAVANDGLDAKIMREGSLSARYSDEEFQINAVRILQWAD